MVFAAILKINFMFFYDLFLEFQAEAGRGTGCCCPPTSNNNNNHTWTLSGNAIARHALYVTLERRARKASRRQGSIASDVIAE